MSSTPDVANDNLHPRERIIQEYRRVIPPRATDIVTPPHNDLAAMWEERCVAVRRVQELEAENAELRRQSRELKEALRLSDLEEERLENELASLRRELMDAQKGCPTRNALLPERVIDPD